MSDKKESQQVSVSTVYETLWKCRDFEIDHVWQRAVFLSAFLLACYAGYGSVVIGFATAETVKIPLQMINVILLGISMGGLILSLVWIMMAKGSKAWYEHYEAAISVFEHCAKTFEDDSFEGVLDAHKMIGFEIPSTSSWLWNTKGGAYSVAKINIVLGHLSTLIWLALVVAHLVASGHRCQTRSEVFDVFEWICDVRVLTFGTMMCLLVFWLYTICSIKSSFLKEKR